jgi:hypothetical protein
MKRILIALSIVALSVCAVNAAESITVNASVILTSGAISETHNSGAVVITPATSPVLFASGAVTLSTAWQPISIGSVGTLGYCWARNATTNNIVDIGVTNAAGVSAFATLDALNVGMLPLYTGGVYYARAGSTVVTHGTNAPTTNVTATLQVYVQGR